jgi:hypothetical protein
MLRMFFAGLAISLALQSVFAKGSVIEEAEPSEEIIQDVMPSTAPKWACPTSVKIGGIEYKNIVMVAIFDGPPEEQARLHPEPRKYVQHHFYPGTGENVYLSCGYEGLETPLIIHAKGATHCGEGGAPRAYGCWDGPSPPPYNRGDPRLRQ